MAENRVLFIINRYSGTNFQEAIEGRIIDACSQLQLEATIEYTKHKGHATVLARQAVEAGFPRVFAMGGDGTVNEVAQALVQTSTALGILPKGSGNGLARHLHIPLKTPQALQLLDKHKIVTMDTIRINGLLSVNVSGIGFVAHVAGKVGNDGKRGLISYGKLVMKEFPHFNEFPIELKMDGKILKRKSFILALANSSQFGNNAKISPFASVCDQLIDVCFIKKVPLTQAVAFAQKMFTGHMNRSRFVEVVQGKNVRISFDVPMPYHIDGEAMEPVTTFEVLLVPGSLRIVVPNNPKLHP